MFKRAAAAVLLTAAILGSGAAIASATPGPGESNQCAPGQHDGQGSADRPASCDNK